MPLAVARSIEEVPRLFSPRESVVTLGVFDGVHRGHACIIEEVLDRRERDGLGAAYLITFDPHPSTVTGSRTPPPVLSTIEERLALFSRFDLDGVLVVEFNAETAAIHYRDFIERYLLEGFGMRHLVLGYDHHFGHRREGSPTSARAEGERRGFGVTVVEPVQMGESIVSSTAIRSALEDGDLHEANRLLGHPYLVAGQVVAGRGRGADLGFPTANLAINHPHKLWPPPGVFAVRVDAGERRYGGMMNVGTAPTVKGGKTEIEVHIFGLDRDLYGQGLLVHCEARLRDERRFDSVEDLVAQLERDRRDALAVLENGA